MSEILKVTDLFKSYDHFTLDHINLQVPAGCVTGFIGSNGAGKTTTIKSILGLIKPERGSIELFEESLPLGNLPASLKQRIGVVFDTIAFPSDCRMSDIAKLGQAAYEQWDKHYFSSLLSTFELDERHEIKSLSRGMGMKLQLAFALAHHPNLLILDEATAGLDPLARDEVLDMLREFMNDENHGILLSSHITSDLEKIADYVVCVDDGKHIFTKAIDEICDLSGIAHCRAAEAEEILTRGMFEPKSVRIIRSSYSTDILVPDRMKLTRAFPSVACDRANLEDYMRFMLKGEVR